MCLQILLISQHVAKLGRVLLSDSPLRRLAKRQQTAFMEG